MSDLFTDFSGILIIHNIIIIKKFIIKCSFINHAHIFSGEHLLYKKLLSFNMENRGIIKNLIRLHYLIFYSPHDMSWNLFYFILKLILYNTLVHNYGLSSCKIWSIYVVGHHTHMLSRYLYRFVFYSIYVIIFDGIKSFNSWIIVRYLPLK